MQTHLVTPQTVLVTFNAWEVFRVLTALEEQAEKGMLDPALQDLRLKLNDALPFSGSFMEHFPESD